MKPGLRRNSPLAPYRVVPIGTVIVLAALAFLFLRGPAAWQRAYYPLTHVKTIAAAAKRHSVNPYLVAAVIDTESSWDEKARSEAGAIGLMQVMPSTAGQLARQGIVDARRFPPDSLEDPRVNIEYGVAYLRYLVERYHEIEKALAAYNAGLANADEWARQGGDIRRRIDFPQTRNFVLKVSRAKDRYRALYPDAFEGWNK